VTPDDVEAGKRAGVRVAAVRCEGWTDAELVGAVAVYDNPADLLARFEQLPFAIRPSGRK
jgi:phosphoglycolate phosphatase-like HAD superfamily hydrolase